MQPETARKLTFADPSVTICLERKELVPKRKRHRFLSFELGNQFLRNDVRADEFGDFAAVEVRKLPYLMRGDTPIALFDRDESSTCEAKALGDRLFREAARAARILKAST